MFIYLFIYIYIYIYIDRDCLHDTGPIFAIRVFKPQQPPGYDALENFRALLNNMQLYVCIYIYIFIYLFIFTYTWCNIM